MKILSLIELTQLDTLIHEAKQLCEINNKPYVSESIQKSLKDHYEHLLNLKESQYGKKA